jgi:nucleoside-diphosphate-sugar epimerase
MVVEDIASAHIKAVDICDKLENNFEPFYITQTFPYTKQEIQQLSTNPKNIVEKYYPGAWDWFLKYGITLNPVATYYDSTKAKNILGWEPVYTFGSWWKGKQNEIK